MPSISLKAPKSKSPSSITNLFIIFIVATGFYLLYKYIKCIDKDISLFKLSLDNVKNDIEIINRKIESTKDIPKNNENVTCYNDICYSKVLKPENDNDDASIQSDEINCILKNITEEEDTDEVIESTVDIKPTVESTTDVLSTESNDVTNVDDKEDSMEDIIICRKTTADYQTMTNEVIKNMIKELGGVPKGNKSALIEQLISLQE